MSIINEVSLASKKATYLNLDSFFEFINMPPFCTSAILIKRFLNNLVQNNTKPSFKLLKSIIVSLRLECSKELGMIRNYIKIWFNKHYKCFHVSYCDCFNELEKPNVLKLTSQLKQAYLQNRHTPTTNFNIYKLSTALEENRINDKKTIRILSNAFKLNRNT